MPVKIAAVIFDMDGVLIDAREWHYEALNRALRLFGYEISRYDHLHAYDGLPTRKKLEMLSRQHGLPVGLHDFVNDLKQRYTLEIVHACCKPVFTHEYALARLQEDGYRLGLASNSVRRTVETMMEYANLRPRFEVMLSNEDVARAKPDPEIYLKAAAALGVAPAGCLVLEDNFHGVQSARAAGAHVLEVADVHDVTYDAVRRAIALAEGGER
jgi:beta-phosphoglucomutase